MMSSLVRAIRTIASSGEASRAIFPGRASRLLNRDYASQRDVAELATKLADALRHATGRGACVILAMPHGPDFVSAILACFCADVTAVPAVLNDEVGTVEEAEAIWSQYRRCRAAGHTCVVLGNASALRTLASSPNAISDGMLNLESLVGGGLPLTKRRVPEASVAVLLMTSGSEGRPKGVPLSHGNIWHQIQAGREQWSIDASSRPVTWLSPNHNFGLLFGALVPFFTAASCRVIATQDFAKQPSRWFHAIADHKATHVATPNFAFDLCCDAILAADVPQQALTSISHVICGGEPVQRAAAIRFFETFACLGAQLSTLQPHYGMSECGSISTARAGTDPFVSLDQAALGANQAQQSNARRGQVWIASCGSVPSDTKVRIWDTARAAPCGDGNIGEILVASKALMAKYWFADADAGSDPFLDLPEGGRYFRTGDLGFMGEGGLVITGRCKDVIIQRGKNHYPVAIEATAHAATQDWVAACAVFTRGDTAHDDVVLVLGLAGEEDGESIRPAVKWSELAAGARKAISKTHGLDLSDVVIVDRTAFGSATAKIKRGPLKAAYTQGTLPILWCDGRATRAAQTGETAPIPSIVATLRDHVFAPILGTAAQKLSDGADFGEFGLNSLQCARIAGAIEKTFGRDFSPSVLYTYTTLRQLANYLSSDAGLSRDKAAPAVLSLSVPSPQPVKPDAFAIVGMHCDIPGAGAGTDAFWELLSKGGSGVGSIANLRPELWRALTQFAPIPPDRLPRHAGLLTSIDTFDADFFGISRREAECMDPQQRKILQFIWALGEVSGHRPSAWDGRPIGLFVGAHSKDYADLLAARPDVMASSGAYIDSGTHFTMIANRASRWFNFKGPSEVYNTACSSSLVALHHAVRALRAGECESALVVGVNLISAPVAFLSSAQAGMLSKEGACKTLDASADGFVRSEALGGVILKPLSAAKADGDTIYGVIRASGVNHDGRSNSLRAPNGAAQRDLMLSVYGGSGIDPSSVSYVELHGTGTVLGDPIEVNALAEAFQQLNPTIPSGACAVGSVKANIGHAESAAGLVGLIKVLLCLRHRMLVKAPNLTTLNPNIDLAKTPFRVLWENEPWTPDALTASAPLRAGLSSFGFGGVNAHVIVEGYDAPRQDPGAEVPTSNTAHIFVLSAKSDTRLADRARQLLEWLDRDCDACHLADLARTLQMGRDEMDVRLGVIAANLDDLKLGLSGYLAGTTYTNCLATGHKAHNPGAFRALESDGTFAQTVASWIASRNLAPLLELWVQGVQLDWSSFWTGNRRPMLSLPTYPFARDIYWLPEVPPATATPHPLQATPPQDAVALEVSTAGLGNDILADLAKILKTNVSDIDTTSPFSEIGLDSIGLMNFADHLNARFGWNISPTVFYEYTTMQQLLAHVLRTYGQPALDVRLTQGQPALLHSEPLSAVPVVAPKAPDSRAIAIIGLSGSFPKSPDIPTYWDNLVSGRDCISEIPDARWGRLEKDEIRFAGVLEDIEQFDPMFFGISPREAYSMDPQHRLLLTHAWQALEDAGYAPKSLAGSDTAVIVGSEHSGYSELLVKAGHPIESFSAIGMVASMGPNRLSHLLDLHGPSEPVETACSSSLVAIHRAVDLLRRGECSMALAGGVNTIVSRELHSAFGKAGMLSPDGQCRTFSAAANGYVRGEGVGILLLKTLEQAERDGDPIYATILGTAINHGGKSASLTAPNPRAQANLIQAAIVDANVDPTTISYVEMHGTGTPLGDPIEFQGLETAMPRSRGDSNAPCGLGSVKSNIGHLELAAGVAGVIKVLLQMKHKTLVPSLHCTPINPKIAIENSPFYLVQDRESWTPLRDPAGHYLPLRAGVSSFGAGGVNAHVILQDYPHPADRAKTPNQPVLIVLSARTRDQLTHQAQRLQAWLNQNPTADLTSLAYTLQVGRDSMAWRLAIVTATYEALHARLSRFVAEGTTDDYAFLTSHDGLSKADLSQSHKNVHPSADDSGDQDHLAMLAQHWVDGARVVWAALYPDRRPHKLRLPPYPFAQQAFWPTSPSKVSALEPTATSETSSGDLLLKARHWRAQAIIPTPSTTTQIARRVITIGFDDASHQAIAATTDAIAIKRCSEDTVAHFAQSIVALTEIVQTQYARPCSQTTLLQIVVPATGEEGLLAAVSGWLRALYQERPDLQGQLIAVDIPDPQTLPTLLAQDASMPGDMSIRYLDRTRYVASWRDLRTKATATTTWAAGGTYIITGGFGGLGRGVAQDIRAKAPSANLVLVGRSTPAGEHSRFLETLRDAGGGGVDYEVVDLTDGIAVARMVAQINNRYGGITGVIHTAGVIRDSLIHNKTPDAIHAVLAAKVAGTYNLDAATKAITMDIFVCFSSLVAILGNQGQSDYAAANAFMDHFAEYRNRLVTEGKRHGHTLSVNWPIWDGGGMHIDDHTRRRISDQTGLVPLPMRRGLQALEAALASQCTQVLVAYGDTSRFSILLTTGNALKDDSSRRPDFDAGGALDTRNFITATIAKGLNLPVVEVDLDAGLETYGLDSLMVMQLTGELERLLGPLPKTLFFEYPTLRALIDYLVKHYNAPLQRYLNGKPSGPIAASVPPMSEVGAKIATTSRPAIIDIAIIGLAGTYPGAPTLEDFWTNLKTGTDSIGEIPSDRWDHALFFDPNRTLKGKTYSKWGGFINGHDEFDPLLFSISPRDASLMDPQERLFLQCAHSAIEDAGYTPHTLDGRPNHNSVAVFVGAMYSEYQLYGAQEQSAGRAIALNGPLASIANRVSYCFDFHGPSMTVDTMCSSSLAAIHMACQSLRLGDCEVALAGGVNLNLHPNKYLALAQGNFLSSTGRCRSFGQGGDGYVPAEAVGAVILKPLDRAIQDKDSIYAVIRGTALNNGGKTNGFSVPNPNSQADAIREALDQAQIDPATITYIEAHGTGTALGDPIEVAGLTKVFGGPRTSATRCAIGSVKSNIGHCEAAAGIAALTKVLLQLRAGEIAPSLHAEALNENINFDATPFHVQTRLTPWPNLLDTPRRAGVSSFGAGGTNVHIVVEEFPTTLRFDPYDNCAEAIVLSAQTKQALTSRVEDLYKWLLTSDVSLDRVAHTLQIGRQAMDVRMAFVVRSRDSLTEKLAAILSGTTNSYDVWEGDVRSGRSEMIKLRDDLAYQSALNQQLANRDFSAPLAAWVSGLDIDWSKARLGPAPQRAHLPTYPFATERYWAPTQHAFLSTKTDSRSEPRPKVATAPTSDAQLLAAVIDHIATASGVATERIDPDVSLRDYGIDSVHAIGLSSAMCEAFNLDLSPTALFTFDTATALASHIGDIRGRVGSGETDHAGPSADKDGDELHLGLRQIRIPGNAGCPVALFYPTHKSSRPVAMGGYTLNAAVDAEPDANPRGLILMSHGFGGTGFAHHRLARHLAMCNFLVAAPHHTTDVMRHGRARLDAQDFLKRTGQLRETLDFLLNSRYWGELLNGVRVGAIGHSGGGASVLGLLGAQLTDIDATASQPIRDPRISAAVLMAPMAISFRANSLASIQTPLWVLTAQVDEYRGDTRSEGFYTAHLPHARHDNVRGAGHFSFMSLPDTPRPASAHDLRLRDPEGFDRKDFEVSHHAGVSAFFHQHLVETTTERPSQPAALATPVIARLNKTRAVLFPGQGAQATGMGQGVFDEDPDFVANEEAINHLLGFSVRDVCLNGPKNILDQTQYTQPCIYIVNSLHYTAYLKSHPEPNYVAGHSLGEYNALLAAGVFSFLTGLQLVKARADLMRRARDGAMAAVIGLTAEQVFDNVAKHHVTIDVANFNAPLQTVVAGPRSEVRRARETFKALGARHYVELPVSGAFHSRYMTSAAHEFAQILQTVALTPPAITVISNLRAEPYPSTADGIRTTLANQIAHPVQWTKTVQLLLDRGADPMIEIGNGEILTRLVDQIRGQE